MRKLVFFCFTFFILSIFQATAANYDFDLWAERNGTFTVGRPSSFLIYIQNKGTERDSYTITYDVNYFHLPEGNLSHLIGVHLPSNKIEYLEPGKIRDTQGTIIVLANLYDPGGTVTFNATSDSSGIKKQATVKVTGGGANGTPLTLPEFGLAGLVQFMFLVALVVLYSFHFRKSLFDVS